MSGPAILSAKERAATGREPDPGPVAALAVAASTLAAVGVFFLLPYIVRHFRYPVGWDAAFYVWRANAVTFDGLARIGTVRAASPVLMAEMMRLTGQNAFTMAALIPAVLAGLVALAAGAMVRAALRTTLVWVPVVGVLSWVAFGRIGMMDGHLDNVLNAALVMSGFACAVGLFAYGRGAMAATALFMAAGLAEWPFYVFAIGVLITAIALHSLPTLWARRSLAEAGPVRPLLWSVGVSAGFTGLTFLARPAAGGVGVNIGLPKIRQLLRERFVGRLGDAVRYWAYPLGAAGGWVAAKVEVPPARRPARRFFVSLMAGWTIVTLAAGTAQLAGVPVAGARLLYYFFAPTILTGVLVWWSARWLAAWVPGAVGAALAVGVTAISLLAFGSLAYRTGASRVPWIEGPAVRQTIEAGAYVADHAARRDVVYLIDTAPRHDSSTVGRWWHTVRAALPAAQVSHAHRFIGSPAAFLSGPNPPFVQDSARVSRLASTPVAIVLQRYNSQGFAVARGEGLGRELAPGVMVLRGPAGAGQLPAAATPVANTRPESILSIATLVVVLLYAAGGGWSIALVSGDSVLRAALAPGLGVSALVLFGVAWDRVGLGFRGWEATLPAALAATAGWAAGGAAALKRARAAGGEPKGRRAGWDPGPVPDPAPDPAQASAGASSS